MSIETKVIQTTADQRHQAQMGAMALPMMIEALKDQARAKGHASMIEFVEKKMESMGITEDFVFDLVIAMASARDIRVTLDGELAFRICPED